MYQNNKLGFGDVVSLPFKMINVDMCDNLEQHFIFQQLLVILKVHNRELTLIMLIAILAIYTKGVPLDIQGHFKFGSSYFFTRQLGEDYFFFKKLPRPPDIKWCAPITHDKTVLLINQSMTYQTVRDLQHVPRDVLIQFHILPNCRYFLQNQRQIAK